MKEPAATGGVQTTTGSMAIEVHDLHLALEGRPILSGVNLRIPSSELVALIGPNGSGKTTLLRCLLGLQRPDRGGIRLLGERRIQKILPRVGYVPQKLALDPSFIISVREFLCLRLRNTRHWFWHRRSWLDHRLRDALAEMEVEKLLDAPLGNLSGGEWQRVLIAFSLAPKPDLLLLDEPTAGVDAPGEHSFYEIIAGIQQRHRMTVVLVSHDLSMVYRHATWVYALNRVICCEGPPERIMNAESLKQAYGIHVSPYQHHHHHPRGSDPHVY